MAKGQKKSNREIRKAPQPKAKTVVIVDANKRVAAVTSPGRLKP